MIQFTDYLTPIDRTTRLWRLRQWFETLSDKAEQELHSTCWSSNHNGVHSGTLKRTRKDFSRHFRDPSESRVLRNRNPNTMVSLSRSRNCKSLSLQFLFLKPIANWHRYRSVGISSSNKARFLNNTFRIYRLREIIAMCCGCSISDSRALLDLILLWICWLFYPLSSASLPLTCFWCMLLTSLSQIKNRYGTLLL